MTFLGAYLSVGAVIMGLMIILWLISLWLKNSSIVDIFWGTGFVISSWTYFTLTPDGFAVRKLLAAILLWFIGFYFEAAGDWQLARFKADPANKGKVMMAGVWKYTRHPNYFGDATQWWAYYLVAAVAGGWWTIYSPLIMTILLVRVSGVALLEKTLKQTRPGYLEYVQSTSAFIPWFPRKKG